MIEKTILDYLNSKEIAPAWMEIPKNESLPDEYIIVEKTGSGQYNHISSATFAIQSYAQSMYGAAVLNEAVKSAMEQLVDVEGISDVALNSDYNFTDVAKKNYRYQAVFDIVYHK